MLGTIADDDSDLPGDDLRTSHASDVGLHVISVIYVNYNYNENREITRKNGPLTITITTTK